METSVSAASQSSLFGVSVIPCLCAREHMICLSQDCALDSSPVKGSTQNFALAYKRNKLEFAATALRIEIALAQVLEGRNLSMDWDASGMRETVQQNCSKEDDMLRRQRGTSEEWQARPIEFGGSIGWAEPGTMGWVVVAAHAGVLVAAFLFCLVLVLCGMVCLCTKSPCQVCTKLSANESSLILRSDLPPPWKPRDDRPVGHPRKLPQSCAAV